MMITTEQQKIKHPRDIYANFEGIWKSYHDYIAKRLPLEQSMIDDYTTNDLVMTSAYLDKEIAIISKRLQDMRAIRTIIQEVLEENDQ